ncbi:DUF5703 domain-containing protein [Niabella ginsengisoli]|uniref:DUF5703 domain-containing protein n=1 Tax=Niabella ginsengisoli TaxID=522298 RepID=A0ABS9SHK8_9BACT|nr:DUF5703 domain-containing protein [Niabella ginsengisoli]MCH5597856.1 DUF5703 domain-containing protein [Niabella ginsengisoli]
MLIFCIKTINAQDQKLNAYNVVWNTQSKNASESMPLGGGDIGCNVWVENNELLFYFSQSGSFDENNAFLKSGRIRLKLYPNPFMDNSFKQELILKDGYVQVNSGDVAIKLWVDVFKPVIHIDIASSKSIRAEAIYENWRFADRLQKGKENNANSWKWASHVPIITKPDVVGFNNNHIIFYHRNTNPTVFDATVQQQGLDSVKHKLFNPLENLTSGGLMRGRDFIKGDEGEGSYVNTAYKSWSLVSKRPSKKHLLEVYLHHKQTSDISIWKEQLNNIVDNYKTSHSKTISWWNDYWKRSFVFIDADDSTNEAVRSTTADRRKTDATYSTAGSIKKKKIRHGRLVEIISYSDTCLAAMLMVNILQNLTAAYLLLIRCLQTVL